MKTFASDRQLSSPARSPAATTAAPRAACPTPQIRNILHLQRKAGCSCGGGCPACTARGIAGPDHPAEQVVQMPEPGPDIQHGPRLQAKLKIGATNDPLEHEADRVADEMMRMPDPEPAAAEVKAPASTAPPGAPPTLRRLCTECEEELQRKEEGAASTTPDTAPPIVHEVLRSPGQPLDAGTRSFFEPRFGRDLSHVRVHSDARAAESAAAVHAQAYAVGNNIVLGAGRHAPGSDAGRRLLAHELAHVGQQNGGETLIQRELVYASGYPRRFRSDRAEVRCYRRPACTWYPASIDFRATAEGSGGGTGQSNFRALLDHIATRAPGSISELGLIGHANSEFFGLSGDISADDVEFTEPGLIGAESLERERARIEGLRNRFAPDAKIILYGCNAGAGAALLEAISRAFQVCVRGFSDEILTCLQWRTPSRKIFSRGRVYVDTAGLVAADFVKCPDFHANVRDLNPDRESCAGVPVAEGAPETRPHRFGVELRPGAALSGESWRGAVSLGARYSLRSDRLIVVNPMIGAQLLYLPPAGELETHVAAAIAELVLRVQRPLQGVYADLRVGAYAGLELPTGGAGPTAEKSAVGGFTAALGAGYRWERLELGAEARGLVGEGPDHFLIVGVGSLRW